MERGAKSEERGAKNEERGAYWFALRSSLLALLLAWPALAQDFQGATIGAIRFETDVRFDTSKLSDIISVKVGDPLSRREIQSSVEALYKTGDFRDVVVDAARSGMDVALTFRLSIHYRIADLDLEGFGGQKQAVQKELAIRRGDVLSLDAVDRSAIAMQEALRKRGYLEATVDPSVTFRREENQAEVVFNATLGPEAKIAAIEFEGNLVPFSPAELMTAMKRKIGDEFRTARARSDADRLERFLINKKYRRADVRFLEAPYDAATDTVRLRYRVNVGPPVRVEVAGVERSRVRKWIPFRKNEGYSGDVIERARDRIIEEFQKRGHFFVAVDITEETVGSELVITYQVEPGPRYKLDDIDFEGNVKISDKKLKDVMATRPAGGFRSFLAGLFRRHIGVTQKQLNADAKAINSYYALQGFTEAVVKQPVAEGKPDGTLDVRFPIIEGPQTLVEAVIVEGNEKISTDDLPELQLRVGDPLNPQLVRDDQIALQTHYYDKGYAEMVVSQDVQFTPDKTGATVRFKIQEGPRVEVDDVVVQGNTYTDREVILRKSRLEKGEPFSFRSILEAQRNLYRLGIFQRVELFPDQAGTTLSERDVVIQVDEGRNLTVSGSIGYNQEQGAGGSVNVSHRNLFGTARYAGIEALYFEKRQRYSVSYQEPFIFGYDIPTQVTVFRGEEERNPTTGGDAFANFRRFGTFVEASRVVREVTEWSLRYEYRIVECVVKEPDNPTKDLCVRATDPRFPIPGFPREEQTIDINSVTPTFFWDRRNDPLNPTSGFFASASTEYAFPLFRADTHFAKGFTQGAWYRPLSARSQIALSGRFGVIEPLNPEDDPDAVVPFAERFLAGGETTHRAFDTDTLGVFCEPDPSNPDEQKDPDCRPTLVRVGDDIVAIGGNALALLSAEYRFPIFGQLRGAVFADAGNVFADSKDLFSADEFRYGAGVGLRYLTPVGPVRFDIGWKLDRKEGEDPYATFLSLGYAF